MLLKPKDGQPSNSQTVDVRGLHKQRAINTWTWPSFTFITTGIALLILGIIVHASLNLQVDPQGCVMSMMSPTYIKLSGFDTEHSRFASKYSLYLYREEGVDEYTQDNLGLRGAPVLFVPGNAGSYKQVRSLSSEASRYYQNHLRHNQAAANADVRALDFFTVDFNEDLAAFHGQTVIDQAEYVNEAIAYILSLYHDTRGLRRDSTLPDPSSVILIGHSMGGIVARTVLVNTKYQANSVNTIITMSTPHARPPVSFDADIVSLYEQINDYWRDSYSQKWSSNNPLSQTTLISIAGGGRDTTVPSDYTSVASLVPETHGFTVFTSTIPFVWTSMDHLAITWADQVRKVIVKSLYEVVDVRRPAQTRSRAERIQIFRKWFLTGLEESAPKNLLAAEHDVLLTLGDRQHSSISKAKSVTLSQLGAQDQKSAKLLPIPMVTNETSQVFSLLTDQWMDDGGSFEKIDVLFCSAFPLHGSVASSPLPSQIDLSEGDASATRLACKRPAGDAIVLPASTRTARYPFEQVAPFVYLQYDLQDLRGYQFVAIIDKSLEISNNWVHAEINKKSDAFLQADAGLFRLLTKGLSLELPSTRPMMTEIVIPALHSSLLAYHLKIRQHGCRQDTELFTPLLRQHIDTPYESKYFVNFKEADVNLHGSAPFMPPGLDGRPSGSDGVAFQIWSDPTCNSSLEFQLKADFTGSLGKLVIRYRTIFAAFPLLIVAMVLRKQFRIFDNTGMFISFTDSLDQSLRLSLPIMLMSMTFFATAFTTARPSGASSSIFTNNATVNYAQNDLLLGSQDSFFWFLVPLAGLISVGACVVLNYLVLMILHIFSVGMGLFAPRQGYTKLDETQKDQGPITVNNTPRRRLVNTIILLVLVGTIIPYPFAYVVACIVQFVTCTRALRRVKECRTTASLNFFNYAHSILVLMLWVLPINLPVLVVWVHNLAVHWLTPFSSHHNVLSIMPFIVLVESVSTGAMVPPMKRFKWTTNLLFFVLAVYSAVYGMTYAYRLHYIANIIALWLVLLHFSVQKARVASS